MTHIIWLNSYMSIVYCKFLVNIAFSYEGENQTPGTTGFSCASSLVMAVGADCVIKISIGASQFLAWSILVFLPDFLCLNSRFLACRSSHSQVLVTLGCFLPAFRQTSKTQKHTCHHQLLMSFPFARSAVSRVKDSEITDSVWQLLCWHVKSQLMPLQCLLKMFTSVCSVCELRMNYRC